MSGRKRPRPTKSVATNTWKPRKRARITVAVPVRNVGFRTGGFGSRVGSKGELKWIDNNSATAGVASFTGAGVTQLLNGCAQGTTSTTRIGRKIVNKSITGHVTLGCGTAGATVFRGKLKMLIFYDSQANATAAAPTDVLISASADSLMNLDNRGRFKVLRKKTWVLDQSGGMGAAGFDFTIATSLPTIFNSGSTGTFGDIQTGSLWALFVYTNSGGAVPTNTPNLSYNFRVRFMDD